MRKLLISLSFFVLTACQSAGVIGVKYDKKGMVHFVMQNSPAERAGLKPGDIILNPKELRGPVGSEILVKYLRDAKTCSIILKRVHIRTLE